MKYFLSLFFVHLSLLIFSQNFNSNRISERLKVGVPFLRDHIYAGIPTYYKKDKYEKLSYVFADKTAYAISNLLESGSVYSEWDDLEKYINEILNTGVLSIRKDDLYKAINKSTNIVKEAADALKLPELTTFFAGKCNAVPVFKC